MFFSRLGDSVLPQFLRQECVNYHNKVRHHTAYRYWADRDLCKQHLAEIAYQRLHYHAFCAVMCGLRIQLQSIVIFSWHARLLIHQRILHAKVALQVAI